MDATYYSIYDGFVFYDEEGNLIPYEFSGVTDEEWEEVVLEKKYSGQYEGGDGTIFDPDKYVKDKYGEKYKAYSKKVLSNFEYMDQGQLSVYIEDRDGVSYSEGNCTLSSIYALLNYLQSIGKYPNFPSSGKMIRHIPVSDSFYGKIISTGKYKLNDVKVKGVVFLPELYDVIRCFAIEDYGYEVSGTNPFNIVSLIKKTGNVYANRINATHIVVWSFESQVVDEINKGYPYYMEYGQQFNIPKSHYSSYGI